MRRYIVQILLVVVLMSSGCISNNFSDNSACTYENSAIHYNITGNRIECFEICAGRMGIKADPLYDYDYGTQDCRCYSCEQITERKTEKDGCTFEPAASMNYFAENFEGCDNFCKQYGLEGGQHEFVQGYGVACLCCD